MKPDELYLRDAPFLPEAELKDFRRDIGSVEQGVCKYEQDISFDGDFVLLPGCEAGEGFEFTIDYFDVGYLCPVVFENLALKS